MPAMAWVFPEIYLHSYMCAYLLAYKRKSDKFMYVYVTVYM